MVFPPLLLLDFTSDLTTISFIFSLLLLSFLSLIYVFHFRFKIQTSRYLKDFNSLWTVRILLVSFIFLWAFAQFLRLSFLDFDFLSFIPSLTRTQKTYLCKTHIVLSLGFFEPGFLVTLLYIVNLCIKRRNLNYSLGRAMIVIFTSCLPILLLQIFFVFFKKGTNTKPDILGRSFVIFKESSGDDDLVLCTYPLFATIVFGSFCIVYTFFFTLACWKAASVVINRGLRLRIYTLAFSILLSIPIQISCIGISVMWKPDEKIFQGLVFFGFISVVVCAVIGEGVLILRPIADALAIEREACRWSRESNLQAVVV